MMNDFKMSDLGLLSYFLGIEFKITKYGTIMKQSKYVRDLLRRLNIQQSNPTRTPIEVGLFLEKKTNEELVDLTHHRKIVECLRYLCNTRLDLSFSIGLISRFMQEPRLSHLLAAKGILRYPPRQKRIIKGIIGFGVLFPKGKAGVEPELIGYSDSDCCGEKSDRKNIVGYIFFYGGAPISWSSIKE
ncbi:putative mitochondrial protein, partial [Mucuna pruriens]